jgi:muramoyltetrapeptide carboxypeptidase
VCARGGYGANYLLKEVDLEKVEAHPKIFVGYSDITTLLTYFHDAAGMVAFHGPMVAKDWAHGNGVDTGSWQMALANTMPWEVALGAGVSGLVEGDGEGILYGGCLSILVASLGTPYAIQTTGTILFLEDIAAKPYQIDRMLMQLKLGGHFDQVRGIVFGEMLDCVQTANQDYTLPDVVTRIVGDLGVPVAYGVRSGHVSTGNITLPFGVRAKLTVRGGQVALRILESAVSE